MRAGIFLFSQYLQCLALVGAQILIELMKKIHILIDILRPCHFKIKLYELIQLSSVFLIKLVFQTFLCDVQLSCICVLEENLVF